MNKKTDTAKERNALKGYLQQYHHARRMKRILEARRDRLMYELRAPGPRSTLGTMPPARQQDSDGAVSVVFRIDEVESRIKAQQENMTKAIIKVMDLIDLLPADSIERTIVELRHIDCMGWDRIAEQIYLSRSAVFNRYNAALDRLLEHKRAKALVREYIADQEREKAT